MRFINSQASVFARARITNPRQRGGGKFANGAVTGAYVMMFNHLSQQQEFSKGRPLNELQRNEAEMKIQMASDRYRNRMVEYINGEIEDWAGFRFDMNIEGIGGKDAMGFRGYYTANDIQLKLTDETLIIDIQITMTTKSENIVGIITQPSSNWNNRVLMEHYNRRGTLVTLFFRSSADLRKYQNFIHGN